MRKGCKHLRIASILVIALGVISIIGIRMILGSDVTAGDLTGTQLEGALGGLVGLYAFNGFKILAGLIGLALSNKKSILTVILGIILFLCQLVPRHGDHHREHRASGNPLLLPAQRLQKL